MANTTLSVTKKAFRKTIIFASLFSALTLTALPAAAETPTGPTSTPPALGTVGAREPVSEGSKVYTESDGVVRLTFDNAPYGYLGFVLASWDKLDGTWATPQEAITAYKNAMKCFDEATGSDQTIDAKPIADKCNNDNGFPRFEEMASTPSGNGTPTLEYKPTKDGVQNFFVVSMWTIDSTSTGLGYDYAPSEPLFFTLDVKIGPKPYDDKPIDTTPPNDATINIDGNQTKPVTADPVYSFFHETVFSALRTLDAPAVEAARIAATAGLALVLSLLVGFPTQLLNSTLEANKSRFKTPTWWIVVGTKTNELIAKLFKTTINSTKFNNTKAFLIVIASSIIAGFVQPGFGFNWMSVRLITTLLVAFLILNIGSSYIKAYVGKRYGETVKPQIVARPTYLLIVAVTVIFSRAIEAEPAIVFGALLAIELSTRVSETNKIKAELYALLYVAIIGLLGWALFLTAFSTGTDAAILVSELGAVLSVEALATLPILLLPAQYMLGKKIWDNLGWKKWATIYTTGILLFSFILLPMPFSWDTINVPFTNWLTVLLAYSAFAWGIWKYFSTKNKEKSDTF